MKKMTMKQVARLYPEACENFAWSEANKGHDNKPISTNPAFIKMMQDEFGIEVIV